MTDEIICPRIMWSRAAILPYGLWNRHFFFFIAERLLLGVLKAVKVSSPNE